PRPLPRGVEVRQFVGGHLPGPLRPEPADVIRGGNGRFAVLEDRLDLRPGGGDPGVVLEHHSLLSATPPLRARCEKRQVPPRTERTRDPLLPSYSPARPHALRPFPFARPTAARSARVTAASCRRASAATSSHSSCNFRSSGPRAPLPTAGASART